MKRFQFRLAAALNHRTHIEDQKMQAFVHVQQQLALADAKIADLKRLFEETIQQRTNLLDFEDARRRERYLDVLATHIDYEQDQRSVWEVRLDVARTELMQARQARESLDKLRERDQESYLFEMRQEEQKALDEMATQRYRRTSL